MEIHLNPRKTHTAPLQTHFIVIKRSYPYCTCNGMYGVVLASVRVHGPMHKKGLITAMCPSSRSRKEPARKTAGKRAPFRPKAHRKMENFGVRVDFFDAHNEVTWKDDVKSGVRFVYRFGRKNCFSFFFVGPFIFRELYFRLGGVWIEVDLRFRRVCLNLGNCYRSSRRNYYLNKR